MGTPSIAVIIVNWNRSELLKEAVASLLSDGYPNLKIIVVDNASIDGSIATVLSICPAAIIIENNRNYGFSRGNNQGIEEALRLGVDYVFFLNNDATVYPGCLTELVSIFKANPECGAVGPFIVYANNPDTIWYGGGTVSLWSGQVRHLHIRKNLNQAVYSSGDTEYITGCALMVRASILQQWGGFDERYILYSEDVDLCLRIRDACWSLKVNPKALAAHHVSSSTGGGLTPLKVFYRARSTALLLRFRAPRWIWFVLPLVGTIGLLAIIASLVFSGRFALAVALGRGIMNGLLGLKIPVRFRLDFSSEIRN